jgi:hypothetical protein
MVKWSIFLGSIVALCSTQTIADENIDIRIRGEWKCDIELNNFSELDSGSNNSFSYIIEYRGDGSFSSVVIVNGIEKGIISNNNATIISWLRGSWFTDNDVNSNLLHENANKYSVAGIYKNGKDVFGELDSKEIKKQMELEFGNVKTLPSKILDLDRNSLITRDQYGQIIKCERI